MSEPVQNNPGLIDARRLGQAENFDTLRARNGRIPIGAPLSVRILRNDSDEGARWQEFRTPYEKAMRVLDALNAIARADAPDLAFRWFCGSKMCGTCAVRMNGREVLACWEAVEPEMTIEPLRNLPIIRDLVVDRAAYERKVASFEPWLTRTEAYPGFPEALSHRDIKNASKALDCISCASCYSACPVVRLGTLTDFAGPAPLVQLAQTALDPRQDQKQVVRALSHVGIFNCVSCYKCEEVCPAHIPIVTAIIEPLKAKTAKLTPRLARHPLAFLAVVSRRGRIDPGELILRIQGLRALAVVPRLLRLLTRRKIRPLRTLLGLKTPAAGAASRILNRKRGQR